jgi:hypothetical protein
VTQEGSARPILAFSYVEQAYKPIATGAALDFSNSLTSQPVAFADMKSTFKDYFNGKRADDIGEVVKFGAEIQVTQTFTSDKAKLLAAIDAPFDQGLRTKLYDALYQAIDDTGPQSNFRKAIIVATDGEDNGSTRTLAEVTSNAISRNVPVFAIGLGASINSAALEQLATGTGGLYYQSATSQNLATIYRQLSSLLYEQQYILKFDQLSKGPGAASGVTVGVTSGALGGNATAPIISCN